MKGLSTWVWVIGGVIIAVLMFVLFFKILGNLIIEKHTQNSKQSFSVMVNNIEALCDMNVGQSIMKTVGFSDIVDGIYVSSESGIGEGTYLCMNISNKMTCETLSCPVQMESIEIEESILGLVDRLSGKHNYEKYQMKFDRIECGTVTCCGIGCRNYVDRFSDNEFSKMFTNETDEPAYIRIPKQSSVRKARFDISPLRIVKTDVDMAFVADTSGSMGNEWQILCDVMEGVVRTIEEKGVSVSHRIYALKTERDTCTDEVINMHEEDWGPGIKYVAENYAWRSNVKKIIFPISDEGSFEGDPVEDNDRNAIQDAISVAEEKNITVFGLWGDGSSPEVIDLMRQVSEGTGGFATHFGSTSEVTNTIIRAALGCPEDIVVDLGYDDAVEWEGYLFNRVTVSDSNTDPKLKDVFTNFGDSCGCPGCQSSGNKCDVGLNVDVGNDCEVTVDNVCVCPGECDPLPCVRIYVV